MEFKVVLMIISILAFCTFSGILGRNLPDHANDELSSAKHPLSVDSASRPVTISMMRFSQWTRKDLNVRFMKNLKAPCYGPDSSCNGCVTVTNLARPLKPPAPSPPPPKPPPGPPPKAAAYIELPKSPQKSNLKSA